jgi:hypothetical protein
MSGGVQVPQLAMSPPQPSPIGPHVTPRLAHVSGTHPAGFPHWPLTAPPPHVSPGTVQAPHESMFPQPSPAGPHVMCWLAHVSGTQGPPSSPPSGWGAPFVPH